jgi:hypothetical protein
MKARRFAKLITALVVLTVPATVFAYEVGPANFDELGSWWTFEPGVVIPLALSLLLYVLGLTRLRSVSAHAFGTYELVCFLTGWLVLVIALVSPLHPWGSVLFSAHMTQHELLMLVAAPLLVLGRPMIPFLWALPRPVTRKFPPRRSRASGKPPGIASPCHSSLGSFTPSCCGPGTFLRFFRPRSIANLCTRFNMGAFFFRRRFSGGRFCAGEVVQ